MEHHDRITHLLIDHLKSKGVPDNAIALNWGVKSKYVVDLVLLAKEYNTPVSIFEIKVFKNSISLDSAKRNLRRAISALNITVSCYLVFGRENQDAIDIFDITDAVYNDVDLSLETLSDFRCDQIDFVAMQNGIEDKNRAEIDDKNKEKQDTFNKICFAVLPLFCILIIILDYNGIYAITTERLWMYGIIIILVLLPFFKEVSFGNFLVKRNDSGDKRK